MEPGHNTDMESVSRIYWTKDKECITLLRRKNTIYLNVPCDAVNCAQKRFVAIPCRPWSTDKQLTRCSTTKLLVTRELGRILGTKPNSSQTVTQPIPYQTVPNPLVFPPKKNPITTYSPCPYPYHTQPLIFEKVSSKAPKHQTPRIHLL